MSIKYPKMPEHLDRRRKMLAKDISAAIAFKRQGKSCAEIARIFGISETAAKYWTNPEWRERAKGKSRIARRKRWVNLTNEEKKDDNRRTVAVLMRKRELQPEYKKYADQTHYKYAKTVTARNTRKMYYSKNATRLNQLQRSQYQKHRENRLQKRKEYVAKNIDIIRQKMREYYWKNREDILNKHKERRAKK